METCHLTGQKINLTQPNPNVMEFFYETKMTGKVLISDIALMSANSLTDEEKIILTGICRNKTISDETFRITYALFKELKNQEIPYSFEEKANHLLQYLYDFGGKEYKSHDFSSKTDSPIAYSSKEEFERIIEYLLDNGWIDYKKETSTYEGVFYLGLRINKNGIKKLKTTLLMKAIQSKVS